MPIVHDQVRIHRASDRKKRGKSDINHAIGGALCIRRYVVFGMNDVIVKCIDGHIVLFRDRGGVVVKKLMVHNIAEGIPHSIFGAPERLGDGTHRDAIANHTIELRQLFGCP